MKNKYKVSAVLLALAGLAASANANTIVDGKGDLVFSFYAATGSTGAGTNYEVDLGSNTLFNSLSTYSVNLSTADLVSTYGSGWDDRTDLSFAVVGAAGRTGPVGGAANQYWATSFASAPGISTAFTRKTAGATNGISAAIEAMYNGANAASLNGATSIVGFNDQVLVNATLAGSFSAQKGAATFAGIVPQASFGTALDAGTVAFGDLYSVLTGSGASSLVGTFKLTDDGVLSFTGKDVVASPVPDSLGLFSMMGIMGLALTGFRSFSRRLNRSA